MCQMIADQNLTIYYMMAVKETSSSYLLEITVNILVVVFFLVSSEIYMIRNVDSNYFWL